MQNGSQVRRCQVMVARSNQLLLICPLISVGFLWSKMIYIKLETKSENSSIYLPIDTQRPPTSSD